MPSRETLLTFREGLKVIQTVDDYVTLKDTIIRMMAFTTLKDAHYARDAIARTMRKKQAAELQRYQGYPQAISNLDQKYRDLYVILKSAKATRRVEPKQVAAAPKQAPKVTPTPNNKKQMVKASDFNGLNAPLMIINWLKGKKKTIFLGTALASSAGGLYWMYKFLTKEETKDNPEEKEKENSFDRTIKSIQKYRAFTQASKDPDFMGDYEALVSGRLPVKGKNKRIKKKPELDKSTEWEQEERILMRNMDSAFHAIGTKPKVKYELPQLPEPKGIDPSSILTKSDEVVVEKPKRKKPRKRKPPQVEINVENRPKLSKPVALSVGPTMPKPEKNKRISVPRKPVRKAKPKATKKKQQAGRLIPIVKRTKRVKKVRA